MLIGGTFVSIHRDALMNHFSFQVLFFAKRLHHQLLQVAREQFQAVFVRQNHHIFLALAARLEIPTGGEQRGGIAHRVVAARERIHLPGAF